jgi:hypothetical protein
MGLTEPSNDQHTERMLKWFAYEHLPDSLKAVSRPFSELADVVIALCDSGPERTVALRKLLEAKDAAVRARLHPGG